MRQPPAPRPRSLPGARIPQPRPAAHCPVAPSAPAIAPGPAALTRPLRARPRAPEPGAPPGQGFPAPLAPQPAQCPLPRSASGSPHALRFSRTGSIPPSSFSGQPPPAPVGSPSSASQHRPGLTISSAMLLLPLLPIHPALGFHCLHPQTPLVDTCVRFGGDNKPVGQWLGVDLRVLRGSQQWWGAGCGACPIPAWETPTVALRRHSSSGSP